MYKSILFCLLTAVALRYVTARPKHAQPQEKSSLEELAANTQTLVKNVTTALGISELPDSKKIVKVLNDNTQTLANHLDNIVNKLKEEVKAHQGEIDNVIKQVEKRLSETAHSLQQAVGPEATAKAKELRTNLDNGLKTAANQIEKLVKAVEPDATQAKQNIEKAAQTFLNQLNDVSNNLQNEFKKSVEEHKKQHKN